jgi:hypothetical protein
MLVTNELIKYIAGTCTIPVGITNALSDFVHNTSGFVIMRPNKLEKPSSYFIFTDVTSKLFLLE